MKYVNFSYKDAYFLPVWKRLWFIRKLNHDIKTQNEKQINSKNKSIAPRNNSIFKKQF